MTKTKAKANGSSGSGASKVCAKIHRYPEMSSTYYSQTGIKNSTTDSPSYSSDYNWSDPNSSLPLQHYYIKDDITLNFQHQLNYGSSNSTGFASGTDYDDILNVTIDYGSGTSPSPGFGNSIGGTFRSPAFVTADPNGGSTKSNVKIGSNDRYCRYIQFKSTSYVQHYKDVDDEGNRLDPAVKDGDPVGNGASEDSDACGQVIRPYNFDTSVAAEIKNSVVSAGASVELEYTVDVLKRKNKDAYGDTTYRTYTPGYTQIQAIRFLIPKDVEADDIDPDALSGGTGENFTKDKVSNVCAYFNGKGIASDIDCQVLVNDSKPLTDKTHNLSTNYSDMSKVESLGKTVNGHGVETDTENYPEILKYSKIAVPDAPSGTKFCVAVGVWPADSHNNPDKNPPDAIQDGGKAGSVAIGSGENELSKPFNGQENKTGQSWRISAARCSTINKIASAQVWGSMYTNGKTGALVSPKIYADPANTYGTWAEGSITAVLGTSGIASNAAFGYESVLKYYGGIGNSEEIPYCSGIPNDNPKVAEWHPPLMLSSLIVGAKDNCWNSGDGEVKNVDPVSGSTTLTVPENKSSDRVEILRDRFVKGAVSSSDITLAEWDNIKTTYCNAASKVCNVNTSGTVTLGTASKDSQKERDVTIGNVKIPAGYTVVISAKNVTILGNICYEDGTCFEDTNAVQKSVNLKDRNRYSSFSEISALPQMLIFADEKINIRKEVSQVDSWLISEDGILNTCDWEPGMKTITDKDGHPAQISAAKATDCARLLIINGPVMMGGGASGGKGNLFYRSGGAESNASITDTSSNGYSRSLEHNGSVTPAEIFNLRPDVYMWSYWQAQQYTQAASSYTRELAPRL